MGNNKKKFEIPTTCALLFMLLLFCAVLTWIIPAGAYDTEKVGNTNRVIAGTYHVIDKIEQVPAQWAKYHQGAGPIRNKQMVKTADAVLVFWDNESSGTRNIIECARAENIPCKVINI
ncbi:MAG: hypothetical protein II280_02615 [Lachnospiraceae bacterium]|nr:hypothetical protein [Lachnospiraceae bacterium]